MAKTSASSKFTIDDTVILGQGSFGQVFRGSFKGRAVAVKKIQLARMETGDKEPELMRKLSHGNVLKLRHWEDDGEFRYLVLELCHGTLEDYFSDKYRGPMPEDVHSLQQMASGVDYIHGRNLVHRDIKPDNVLIFRGETVQLKISDFGYCKRTTVRGTFSLSGVKGTFHYLAPELLDIMDRGGAPVDERASIASDVFALGCTFHKYLTRGTHPFGQGLHIPSNILNGQFDLGGLEEDHWASQLIRAMIQKEPNRRPRLPEIVRRLAQKKGSKTVETKSNDRLSGPVDCRTGVCYAPGETGKVNRCSFNPAKPELACALDKGKVVVFSASSYSIPFSQWNKSTRKADTASNVGSVDWKIDGSQLAAGCWDGTLVVWNAVAEKSFEVREHSDSVNCIQWNRTVNSAHLFVTGSDDSNVKLWNCNRKTALRTFRNHRSIIWDVQWLSPDCFAVGSWDHTISICKTGQNDPVQILHHQDYVTSLQWNERLRRLASCSSDGSVKVWVKGQNEPVATVKEDSPVYSVDWHRQSSSIAGGLWGSVALWNWQAEGVKDNAEKSTGHSGIVGSVSHSPDGQHLASVDERWRVIVWNRKDMKQVFHKDVPSTGKGYTWNVLSWSPSGDKLAMANQSDKVHVIEFIQ